MPSEPLTGTAAGPAFERALAHRGFLLLDGGLATEMEAHGADLNHPLWSARMLVDDPGTISRVHDSYLAAGADLITTASYQLSADGLVRAGMNPGDLTAMVARSTGLARDAVARFQEANAREPSPLVVASVGPYGASLSNGAEYHGAYPIDRGGLRNWHRDRLAFIITTAPDLLAIETVPSSAEAMAIVDLLEENPTIPAWLSFSCRDDRHTGSGEPIEKVARAVADSPQVVAIGVNCTAPRHVASLLRRLGTVTDKPLVAYPNSGERYSDHAWYGGAEDRWDEWPVTWYQAGARLIGGCCRTTPDTIRQIGRALASI